MGIDVQDMSFSYGNVRALENIRLNIDEGELVGIIGPNGSGKSTLLGCMSGVLKPDAGRVMMDQTNICGLERRDIARKMAFVAQVSPVAFGFTVDEAVLMGRTPHLSRMALETRHDMELTRKSMEKVGIQHLSGRMITNISGGELQRTMIARALNQSPKYLLLDEPTSHLDLHNQLEILELFARLNQEGMTMMAVFHDINLAARYCKRVVMMRDGRVLEDGPTRQVLVPENLEKVFRVRSEIRNHPNIPGPIIDILGLRPEESVGGENHNNPSQSTTTKRVKEGEDDDLGDNERDTHE